eukprot:2355948-Alexandrium_andersonii.AAC.2
MARISEGALRNADSAPMWHAGLAQGWAWRGKATDKCRCCTAALVLSGGLPSAAGCSSTGL